VRELLEEATKGLSDVTVGQRILERDFKKKNHLIEVVSSREDEIVTLFENDLRDAHLLEDGEILDWTGVEKDDFVERVARIFGVSDLDAIRPGLTQIWQNQRSEARVTERNLLEAVERQAAPDEIETLIHLE
jgi:hypothetical protein